MINRVLIIILAFVFAAGCTHNDDGGQGIEKSLENLANNDSIQRKFSDGRLDTIKNDQESKQEILQNTMAEQEMMLTDEELRKQLLAYNIKLNKLMTENPSGKGQLMNSTVEVMDGISQDTEQRTRFVQEQNEIRQKAINDKSLNSTILKQNVREQNLALENPETTKQVKTTALNTSKGILADDELSLEMLKLNIEASRKISQNPELRSEMAHTMLPLLKDPVIAAELQKMIKLAVAQEMKKMQAKMQQQLKQMMQQQAKTQSDGQAGKSEQPAPPKAETPSEQLETQP